ncbi:MAG: BTB/POZ domain-containing protein [Parachlamydia sp.]|nr:BTB/POZ domain-containing protein [Parachlamydia sp.]
MSIGLSEKLITQPFSESSSLFLSKNAKTQRWQIDCADNLARSEESTSELIQKIALLFKEIKENGCAAFWASHRQMMPAIQIQPAVVLKNLQAICLFFKQRVQNGQDCDPLVTELVVELEKQRPQDYLGRIPTDLEYVVGQGEHQKRFKAHKSVLSYFDYWAKAFENKWKEVGSGMITAPETDPDDFEKVLEWIYTGTFSWDWSKKEVEGSEISAKIYELQHLAKTAQAFVLPELFEFCLLRVAQLSHFLKAVNDLDLDAKAIQAVPVPPTYSDQPCDPPSRTKPANAKEFYDVTWICQDKTSIPGNGPLLAARSPIFNQLLANQERDLPAFLPSAFYKEWIRTLHEVTSSMSLKQCVTDQNVWEILPYAEGLFASFCSQKAFDTLSQQRAHLIHSVCIGADWKDAKTELLTELTNLQEVNFDPVETNPVPKMIFVKLLLMKCNARPKVWRLSKCPWVYDTIVHNIADACPNLQLIDLSECKVTDEGIEKLASCCLDLEKIYLNGCKNVSGSSVESIAKHCRQLKVLTLTSFKEITDHTLETVAAQCPQLQELLLNYCAKITSSALAKLATGCPQLRKIQLHGCTAFNDHILDKLATHCPHLQSIDLCHCKEITSEAFEKLALHCPNLQFLNLNGSPFVTDKTVKHLARHCRQLRTLSLNNCKAITDLSIEQLARHCPHLCEISLTGCIQVSNKSIEMLAEHCPKLQVVNLVGCKLITDPAIEKLLANCPKLRACNLVGCEGLSATLLDKVEKAMKK